MRGSGFEGEFRLRDGEALGAIELTGAWAVLSEIFGFFEKGFERFLARFRIEAYEDLKGAGFLEKRELGADLIAEAAFFTELGK